jgi:dUTP pyrophosphatase
MLKKALPCNSRMSYFSSEPALQSNTKYTLWLVLENEVAKQSSYYAFKEKFFHENENAGFDLISTESSTERHTYLSDLGVRAVMTIGDTLAAETTVHYRLVPRSSIYKTGYMMANSEGIIDRTYRGVLKAPVVAVGQTPVGLSAGDRHFQIVAPDLGCIHCVKIVDSFPSTARGEGGFGSTGK